MMYSAFYSVRKHGVRPASSRRLGATDEARRADHSVSVSLGTEAILTSQMCGLVLFFFTLLGPGQFCALVTTGMVKDVDGQRLRRRPNVGTVGVGYILGSPRSWPSA
jgi:hypothetical protein